MNKKVLKARYDAFCKSATELLDLAGLNDHNDKPRIVGIAFLEACEAMAEIHFPEDRKYGHGPKGLLHDMRDAVSSGWHDTPDPDPVMGARSIAQVLKEIIKHRPPLDVDEDKPTAKIKTAATPDFSNSRKVFIVHGHDEAAKLAVAGFIRKLELTPIILHEQSNKGRTIIEKFEDHSAVGFAVVLMTPDDLGASVDDKDNLKSRARQNVILELGFFLGKLGRKHVCALYKEGVEIPSDYQGVLFIPMDKNNGWRLELAKEIKAAGMKVDLNKL